MHPYIVQWIQHEYDGHYALEHRAIQPDSQKKNKILIYQAQVTSRRYGDLKNENKLCFKYPFSATEFN